MIPTAEEILAQLTRLAANTRGVALLWHVAVVFGLGGLWTERWRPPRRLAAMLAALPLGTAAALAIASGNPFSGTVLGLTTLALLGLGARLSLRPVERSGAWATAVGGASVVYALGYPHFTPGGWELAFLFAPVGVVPCPSLALVLGVGLLGNGFGSRAWGLVAAAAGLFYALFGMFRLDVWLDAGLLVAALAMVVLLFAPDRRTQRAPGLAT